MIKKIEDFNSLHIFFNYISINEFSTTFGYFIDNNLVAFINFSIYYERAELNYVWTDEKFRNQGIASSLIDKMLSECLDIENITLEVAVDNISAIKLYKKFGFLEVAKRKGYYNGVDAFLMLKEVN